jgi:hypothetical protein
MPTRTLPEKRYRQLSLFEKSEPTSCQHWPSPQTGEETYLVVSVDNCRIVIGEMKQNKKGSTFHAALNRNIQNS